MLSCTEGRSRARLAVETTSRTKKKTHEVVLLTYARKKQLESENDEAED